MSRADFLLQRLWIGILIMMAVSCRSSAPAPLLPETLPLREIYAWDATGWTLTPLPVQAGAAGETRLRTAAPDTRVTLQDGLSPVWEPGDSFTMYDSSLSVCVYTTEDGGSVADFQGHSLLDSPQYSLYPAAQAQGLREGRPVFGLHIPSRQESLPGQLAPGLHFAYAYSESQGEPLHFQNLLSLLHFRLTGSLVSSVTELQISGSRPLSGDCTLLLGEGGEAELSFDLVFPEDTASRSVVLQGPFAAERDYYIALAPGQQEGLRFTFSDAEGRSLTRLSAQPLRFQASQIKNIGTLDVGDTWDGAPADEPLLYTAATRGEHPVTLAVIPEGFRAEELADYELLARSGLDALFATEPFRSYRDYFNVWILRVASEASGAGVTDGKGNVITPVSSYFSARWGATSYRDMTAEDDRVFRFVEEHCPDILDGTHPVTEVPILMLINDARYGGVCWNWGSGKGYSMVPVSFDGASMRWNYPSQSAASDWDPEAGLRDTEAAEYAEVGQFVGDWRNTLIHEFGGHCVARLTDEYWYSQDAGALSAIASHSWTVPLGLNVSATALSPPWQEWLDARTALMTEDPHYARIGVFQGAAASILHRWRSEKVSCMIDNRSYFSAWQRELIVRRIMSLSGVPFDRAAFLAQDVSIDPVRDLPAQVSSLSPSRLVPPLPPMQIR